MKPEPIDLSKGITDAVVRKLRDGLLFQVCSPRYPPFRGEVYRDEYDNIMFRAWPAPSDPAKDFRVHIGEVTKLLFLNELLPAR